MNWMGICEFVSVAETMSFTQAAKKLATSTAQVSRQITALEQRLNIKLFYRTTRKVSLTYEGEIFYKHCRQVLDDLDKAERAVSDLQSKPQGKIKLTAPITYGEQKILPLVNNFSQHYSNVIIDAYLTNQQVNIVDEGYDLAIRLGKLKDSTLMAKITDRVSRIKPNLIGNNAPQMVMVDTMHYVAKILLPTLVVGPIAAGNLPK